MLLSNKVLATICLILQIIYHINAQGAHIFNTQSSSSSNAARLNLGRLQDAAPIIEGSEKFGLEFFKQISDAHKSKPTLSFMVSPFAIWSLMLLLTEGAGGHTLTELRNTLHTGYDQNAVRATYRAISKYLTVNTTTIEVASFNALFTDIKKPVSREYENIIERDYASTLIPLNFDDVNNTFTKINADVRQATRGLIPFSVNPQDFQNSNIVMISSLYFKGTWKYPFEAAKTRLLPFHDENGNVLGNVNMMQQLGSFLYTNVKEIEAFVLELPYGKEDRLSMLIVLPISGVKLNKVVNNIANVGLKPIHQKLQFRAQYYEYEEDRPKVEVNMPKFSTESHFKLRPILRNMGLHDLFDSSRANLEQISRDNYVSSIFHATQIVVNEEGTEAGAVVTAILDNKALPTTFLLDRPFAYLIVEKTANVLLFAGEVRNYA